MTKVNLKERIENGFFLLDGAMGTELIARGVDVGKCGDLLNVESPDVIFDIHNTYIQAGSDAVLTNTFGANEISLARHGLADMVEQINTASVKIAAKAAGADKYVLGGIGPSGDFLEPLGSLKPENMKKAFAFQAKTLADAGADGILIETQTSLDEAVLTAMAVKSVCDLPVFVSFAYDAGQGRFATMMGLAPADAIDNLIDVGIDAIGFNCGSLNMEQYTELAEIYTQVVAGKVAVLAEPNAGRPELIDEEIIYKVSPEQFAEKVKKIHSAGVNLIGGCCGTTPAHIRALREILQSAV